MKKSTYILFACMLCILAWGVYYFLRSESPISRPVVQPKEESAKMLYTGNSIVQEKAGKRVWEVVAENIEVDAETQNVRLKTVKAVFYQDNGGKLEVTAPQGAMDSQTKDVTLLGTVKAVDTEGATFSAQEVKWVEKDRKMYGTGGITLTKGDTVITGDQIESDANVEKVKVQGNAHVIKGGTSQ